MSLKYFHKLTFVKHSAVVYMDAVSVLIRQVIIFRTDAFITIRQIITVGRCFALVRIKFRAFIKDL